jgi:hypothetical protein
MLNRRVKAPDRQRQRLIKIGRKNGFCTGMVVEVIPAATQPQGSTKINNLLGSDGTASSTRTSIYDAMSYLPS